MKITLEKISKRFNYDKIFTDINFIFISGESYAVIGPNGSGKSTLLKILSGNLTPSSGKIYFELGGKMIPLENIYKHVSYAAPYLELIEEFTLDEIINFHFKLKNFLPGIEIQKFKDIIHLPAQQKKQLKYFSSGMKQRVKLALAVLSDAQIILLDEPTTNLDAASVDWYLSIIQKYTADKLLFIGSNLEREYTFCNKILDIVAYK
ncbi:MAG: ABC transporter ATP-binding protein [Fimbriimonadaceae bacterium]|nr:ABC transporter ATP-binding protein [Chitinophagales bacterium]